MNLTAQETRFLAALLREQNQSGCRGPAHDLLRRHAYPDAPLTGPGSIAFSYETVPLTGLLLRGFTDLQQMDDFVRNDEPVIGLSWPWASVAEYRDRLEEARREWGATGRGRSAHNGMGAKPESVAVSGRPNP